MASSRIVERWSGGRAGSRVVVSCSSRYVISSGRVGGWVGVYDRSCVIVIVCGNVRAMMVTGDRFGMIYDRLTGDYTKKKKNRTEKF